MIFILKDDSQDLGGVKTEEMMVLIPAGIGKNANVIAVDILIAVAEQVMS